MKPFSKKPCVIFVAWDGHAFVECGKPARFPNPLPDSYGHVCAGHYDKIMAGLRFIGFSQGSCTGHACKEEILGPS